MEMEQRLDANIDYWSDFRRGRQPSGIEWVPPPGEFPGTILNAGVPGSENTLQFRNTIIVF